MTDAREPLPKGEQAVAAKEEAERKDHQAGARKETPPTPPSPPGDPEKNRREHRDERKGKYSRGRVWLRLHGREMDVVSNVVIALFAVVVGVTTPLQWMATIDTLDATQRSNRLTQESNDIARSTARRQLRAYIAATSIEPSLVVTEDGRIATSATVTNTGQTPGQGVGIVGMMVLLENATDWPEPLTDFSCPQDSGSRTAGKSVFLPNTKYGTSPHTGILGVQGAEQALKRVQRGELTAYIVGCVRYFDVFESPHTSRFCAVYDFRSKATMACPIGHVWMD